jgi:NADH-quinone oxidoreductase subunit E
MSYEELDTAELRRRAREIIARYPEGKERSALLPLLHLVQSVEGRVTPNGVRFCAERLGLTRAQVGAVATFYTMYKRRTSGRHLVSVCTNTLCGMMGGDKVYQRLCEHLGIGHEETTGDGAITLEHAECLAACDYAPVLTVDYEFFNNVDEERALDIVKRLQAGEVPLADRGALPAGLAGIGDQLAGYEDERAGAVAANATGDPTLRGVRLAAEHDISVPGFDPNTPIPSKQEGK